MSDKNEMQPAPDADLESEIRQARKFSPTEAMARLAGPGAMKDASPISLVLQAETEIGNWLRSNLRDPGGALQMLLQRNLKGSELVLANLDRPLAALQAHCSDLLRSDHRLAEIVREADADWGRRMDERPHFHSEGRPPHPDDPYTLDIVRGILIGVVQQLDP